jgi:type I restriction enzyme S subunit
MNMTVNARKIPALRFPEFEGEWEERRLEDISKGVMYGMNSAAIPFDGVNKYLRITDIDEGSRAFIPNPLTSPEGKIEDKYKLKEGDIVFTRTGASTGKSYLFRENDGNLYFAGFLIKFSIMKAVPYFVYSSTFRSSYLKWVQVMSMRSGQPGINAEEYKSLKISIPSLPEQQKIATFLTTLDTRIQQLSRKTALLEKYKKGVMQQIFSQEIRFKDEDGKEFPAWEEKRLGEIAINVMYGMNSAAITFDGSHKYVRITDIDEKNGIFRPNPLTSPDGDIEDKYCLKKGDIVFTRTGASTGKSYLYREEDGNLFFAGFLIKFSIIKALPYFVFIYTFLSAYSKWVRVMSMRSGQPGINAEEYKSLKIPLPPSPEQQKIAAFLSTLDNQINLVNQQLERMQTFKKGLLQQLFV